MAAFELREGPDDALTIALSGRLDAYTAGPIWRPVLAVVREAGRRRVIVDAGGVNYCDGAGVGLLYDVRREARMQGKPFEMRNLAAAYQTLLDQFPEDAVQLASAAGPPVRPPMERIGRGAARLGRDVRDHVIFVGEAVAALASALRRPRRLRWGDALLLADRFGVDALPIVALISFLLGVILAFESAIPMRQYGAELYVADLLGLAVVRELGPLMAAILLSGRSGAAFAAEIGTMKINEELNALTTLGLDPVRFLVVTRVLATLITLPLLAIFADLVALVGGGATLSTFGIPPASYVRELGSIGTVTDFTVGIVKSVVYALLVSGIGCLRGLQTRTGPSAVGFSATRAVVSGIIAIVVADGIFAVVLYHLNL